MASRKNLSYYCDLPLIAGKWNTTFDCSWGRLCGASGYFVRLRISAPDLSYVKIPIWNETLDEWELVLELVYDPAPKKGDLLKHYHSALTLIKNLEMNSFSARFEASCRQAKAKLTPAIADSLCKNGFSIEQWLKTWKFKKCRRFARKLKSREAFGSCLTYGFQDFIKSCDELVDSGKSCNTVRKRKIGECLDELLKPILSDAERSTPTEPVPLESYFYPLKTDQAVCLVVTSPTGHMKCEFNVDGDILSQCLPGVKRVKRFEITGDILAWRATFQGLYHELSLDDAIRLVPFSATLGVRGLKELALEVVTDKANAKYRAAHHVDVLCENGEGSIFKRWMEEKSGWGLAQAPYLVEECKSIKALQTILECLSRYLKRFSKEFEKVKSGYKLTIAEAKALDSTWRF